MRKLVTILPFMESDELKELAFKIINKETAGIKLVILYPFLNNEDLDEIVEVLIDKNDTKKLNRSLPFVSKETLNKIYEAVKDGTLEGVNEYSLFPFLGKDQLKGMFDSLIKEASENKDNDDVEDEEDEKDEE